MGPRVFVLALLATCSAAADAGDSTAPPEPINPCETTASPGCVDKPSDWLSSGGNTCAEYVSKAYCTADGGYGSGWDASKDGSFDDWAVNGVAGNVACCGCGGGSTISGAQACQGHSFDKATCAAVGCCDWNVLLGCRANDADGQCYSAGPCATTSSASGGTGGNGKKIVGGLIAGGVIAGAVGAAVLGGTSTTSPGTTKSTQTTQAAQTPTSTTTTENSSSSLLWLWILLGVLALCCLLALCGGGLAALMGGKKKKKTKKSRATRVSRPASGAQMVPVAEEQQELLPMVPPLLEASYPVMPMAAPTMVETVQMVPTTTPMMVETAVPIMQPIY